MEETTNVSTEQTTEKTFTQEEVNKLVGDARKQGRESAEKKFEGWMSPDDYQKAIAETQTQADTSAKTLSELEEKLKASEAKSKALELDQIKTRVALSHGLKLESTKFLSGETEEEITKSAEEFISCANIIRTAPPAATEPADGSSGAAASLRAMAHQISLNNKE